MTLVAAAAGDGLLLGDAGLPNGCDEACPGVSAAAAACAAAAAAAAVVPSLIALLLLLYLLSLRCQMRGLQQRRRGAGA